MLFNGYRFCRFDDCFLEFVGRIVSLLILLVI